MPLIYINTDNSDVTNKIFSAFKAGKSAAIAEQKMLAIVKKLVDKAPGFTTTKGEGENKGYTFKLEVVKVEVGAGKTKCGLSGAIAYYPKTYSQSKHAKDNQGEQMLSTSMTGNATADSATDRALLDCIESITEDLIAKAIPIMRTDFDKLEAK